MIPVKSFALCPNFQAGAFGPFLMCSIEYLGPTKCAPELDWSLAPIVQPGVMQHGERLMSYSAGPGPVSPISFSFRRPFLKF